MSRRVPNPAADRAAQNQQTIKTLLKLEGNKSCADCKRNKRMDIHSSRGGAYASMKIRIDDPRWASWNLGVFVCIRCSGIHRGMGTHISRVKSVDLDAWTDEQLQSVLKWGNARANRYWEAKLAVGHVPSEAKIENFIRTKYESKRWVMDGPMPHPATLDPEGDDDVPLNIVKEKAQIDRSSSQRAPSSSKQPSVPMPKPAPTMDIFGDEITPPVRPSTTDTPSIRAPPPKSSAPPKSQTRPGDSLLGLDFFGGPPSAPANRPSSASANPVASTGPSRPDLKQSILSLYASAPRAQPQSQPQHERQTSFGGMQSPPMQSPQGQQSSFGGLSDAFSGLDFSSPNPNPAPQLQQRPKVDPFAGFGNPVASRSSVAPPQLTSPPPSGGGFFDTTPKTASKPATAPKASFSAPQAPTPLSMPNDDFGDFSFASSPPKPTTKPMVANASADLIGISGQNAFKPAPAPQKPSNPSINLNSAFNLSTPAPQQPKSTPTASLNTSNSLAGLGDTDAWGSNDAWATPDPPSASAKAPEPKSQNISAPSNDFSWGGSSASNGGFGSQAPPKITADEDFGGWSSAAPVSPPLQKPAPQSSNSSKPNGGGFGGSDDLFNNVWG